MQVELYGRHGLARSDDARRTLERVRARIPFDLVDVDVDGDERLRRRYGRDVPVVYLDGRRVFRRRLDEEKLVRRLERARSFAMGAPDPTPVSRAAKVAFAGVAALVFSGVVAYSAVRKLIVEPEQELRALDVTAVRFPAPAFQLPDAKGQARGLADYKGKVVFLNFWASWCPPCREEMPDMARLAVALGDHKDFAMLAISVDDSWDAIRTYFRAQLGFVSPPFVVLRDDGAKVSHAFGTTQFPETYVIDRQGRAVAKFIGARDWSDPAAIRYLEGVLDGP